MVRKFRTKIVEIEAVQWTGDNLAEVQEFTEKQFFALDEEDARNSDDVEFTGEVYDFLHSTWIGVKNGQWIVRGAKGEYYPCDDETFHWKYEEITRWNKDKAPSDAKCPYEGRHQGNAVFQQGDMCRHCGWTL